MTPHVIFTENLIVFLHESLPPSATENDGKGNDSLSHNFILSWIITILSFYSSFKKETVFVYLKTKALLYISSFSLKFSRSISMPTKCAIQILVLFENLHNIFHEIVESFSPWDLFSLVVSFIQLTDYPDAHLSNIQTN